MPDWAFTWAIFGIVWSAFLIREAYKLGVRHGSSSPSADARAAKKVAEAHLLVMGFPREDVARLVAASTATQVKDIERFVVASLVTG